MLLNEVNECLLLGRRRAGRIDDGALAGFVEQQVGVYLEWIENEFFNLHEAGYFALGILQINKFRPKVL